MAQVATASYVEQDCTIHHEGHSFTASGAIVTDKFITGYLGKAGILTDWHGKQIGTYNVLSSWPIHSYLTDRMYSVECFVDGVRYVGRGCGEGMSINAKRSTRKE